MNRIFTILSALSLLLVSCEQFETPTFNNSNEGKVRVTITSGTPQSRTSIAENGLSTTWCNDDQIAVWASNGSSNVLNAQPFAVYYAMGSYVEFTADINPMGDGNFTYYSTHPLPASISGTTATFPIESVQQGSFDGSNDILVAYPTTGLALDNEEAEVSLTFKHKMHSLRMFVPDDVEGMGEPIRRVDITFPTQVVGNVSVDYTSATTPATLSNGSEVVSIEIPEGLSASSDSDRKYAYAIVFPATMNESDQITFTVRSDNYRSVQSFGARSLSEGGSTPVRLTCSPDNRTILRFTIGDNFLGEDPTKVTFTAAIGEAVADCATTFDKYGYYDLDVTDLEGLAGQPITVTYESESAIVSQSLTLPNYEAGKLTDVVLTVPYLLYEDFSGMSAFENNTYEFGAFNYNPSAITLDSYGLEGWTGARIGGGANTNIRIACRFESGIGASASYKGRCDSRPLSQIKSGKSVKLQVTYNYAADLYESIGSGGSVTFWAGTTTTSGAIKGNEGISNVVLGETTLSTDGSCVEGSWYGNTPNTQTYTVDGCGSTTRLSWRVGTNRGGSIAGRGYYWLYIDNVKVSIAK